MALEKIFAIFGKMINDNELKQKTVIVVQMVQILVQRMIRKKATFAKLDRSGSWSAFYLSQEKTKS